MIKNTNRKEKRRIRHLRIREKIKGDSEKPRVSYYRSLKHVYLQAIDDTKGETILSLSTLSKDNVDKIRGFDISIITTAKTDEEAESLLELLGLPFEKKVVKKGSLS